MLGVLLWSYEKAKKPGIRRFRCSLVDAQSPKLVLLGSRTQDSMRLGQKMTTPQLLWYCLTIPSYCCSYYVPIIPMPHYRWIYHATLSLFCCYPDVAGRKEGFMWFSFWLTLQEKCSSSSQRQMETMDICGTKKHHSNNSKRSSISTLKLLRSTGPGPQAPYWHIEHPKKTLRKKIRP